MKTIKNLLVWILLSCSIYSYSQIIDNKCEISFVNYPNTENSLEYKNDSIKVNFTPTTKYWGITVFNKTNEVITIDWNDVVFAVRGESSGIVLDSDTWRSMNHPKTKSQILPKSQVSKKILPKIIVNYNSKMIGRTYFSGEVKKEDRKISIYIPIIYKDDNANLVFDFNVKYVSNK